jgi:hypothetical protein
MPGDTPVLTVHQPPRSVLLPRRPASAASSETRAELEARIEKLRKACGCAESMAGLLVGIGFFCWLYGTGDDHGTSLWQKIIAAILIALAGATAGKILGLLWARHRRLTLQSCLLAQTRSSAGRSAPPSREP